MLSMEVKNKQVDGGVCQLTTISKLVALFSVKLAFGTNTNFTITTNHWKNIIIKVEYTDDKVNYFMISTIELPCIKDNINKYFEGMNEENGKLNYYYIIFYTTKYKNLNEVNLKEWPINYEEMEFLTTRKEENFTSNIIFGKKVLYLQEDVNNLTETARTIFKEKFGIDSGLNIIKTLSNSLKNSSCKNKSYSFTKSDFFKKILHILISDLVETPHEVKISDELYNLIEKYNPNFNVRDSKLNSLLHKTIEKNSTKIALYLINNGAEINATNIYARTPLHLATEYKNLEVFNELIAKNADVEAFDYKLNTALHIAVQCNFQEAIDVLLSKNNVDVNAVNCKDETPIFSAIRNNNFLSYEKLIKRGAFVNISNSHFNTPLHIAVLYNTEDVLENLLSQDDSDMNSKNFLGSTPIALAIESMNYNLFKKLKSYVNCDLHTTDNLQMNLLHLAVYYNCIEILRDLLNLEPKIDLERLNFLGETPLLLAIKLGRKALFDLLRNSEANINVIDCNQNTALHLAMFSKNDEIILAMLTSDLSLNERNLLGKTAIHLVVSYGKQYIFKLVDLSRCDLDICDNYGNTALHFAINYKNNDAIKWLMDSNADFYVSNCRGRNSIHFAAQHGVVSFFENIKEKIEINDPDYVGKTSLHFAVNRSNIEMVSFLLKLNAKVDDLIIASCSNSSQQKIIKLLEIS